MLWKRNFPFNREKVWELLDAVHEQTRKVKQVVEFIRSTNQTR